MADIHIKVTIVTTRLDADVERVRVMVGDHDTIAIEQAQAIADDIAARAAEYLDIIVEGSI